MLCGPLTWRSRHETTLCSSSFSLYYKQPLFRTVVHFLDTVCLLNNRSSRPLKFLGYFENIFKFARNCEFENKPVKIFKIQPNFLRFEYESTINSLENAKLEITITNPFFRPFLRNSQSYIVTRLLHPRLTYSQHHTYWSSNISHNKRRCRRLKMNNVCKSTK